jgi:hypothetical protein
MRIKIGLLLLSISFTVFADDCVSVYGEKMKQLSNLNPQQEAKTAFCEGKPHFKALNGIEYLLVGVPKGWKNKKILVEEIFYYDGIKCDEHKLYLDVLENYARQFNIQMVSCLDGKGLCCFNTY